MCEHASCKRTTALRSIRGDNRRIAGWFAFATHDIRRVAWGPARNGGQNSVSVQGGLSLRAQEYRRAASSARLRA
eukprot:12469481-Alexandrium_andersonii.AAC.1